MNIEEFREQCLSMSGACETMPFGPDYIVFKVDVGSAQKMFALMSLTNTNYVQLKCDPDLAIALRELYADAIEGGYHMNKTHWNGITLDRAPDRLTIAMIAHSHTIVAHPRAAERGLCAESAENLRKTADI